MPWDSCDRRQTPRTLLSASNGRHKELFFSSECHSLPLDQDTGGRRRGVSSVAQPGWALRASPSTGSARPDGQPRSQAPAPSAAFEKSALPDRGSRGALFFHPTARRAPNPRNRQPLFISHSGFPCPRPAAPAPHPPGRLLRSRTATKGRPSPRPPVSTPDEGRLPLAQDSPSRTYFLLASASCDRPQPRLLREQRLLFPK